MVRADLAHEVMSLVQAQSDFSWDTQYMPVCVELLQNGKTENAIRLSAFCAFRDLQLGTAMDEEGFSAQMRLPFFHWLLETLIAELEPAGVILSLPDSDARACTC
jgi:hypothetical protein